jgi:hypothetical protein
MSWIRQWGIISVLTAPVQRLMMAGARVEPHRYCFLLGALKRGAKKSLDFRIALLALMVVMK